MYLNARASYKDKPQTPYDCFCIASHSCLVKSLHAHPDFANSESPAEKGMVTYTLRYHPALTNNPLPYVAQDPFQAFYSWCIFHGIRMGEQGNKNPLRQLTCPTGGLTLIISPPVNLIRSRATQEHEGHAFPTLFVSIPSHMMREQSRFT